MTNDNIPKDYDHKKEALWQDKWQRDDTYKFIGDGTRPNYIIDTPPPYPTGATHMGHVLNWTYIDIIARFKRMQGYDVLFPQGWDCHGLPTEVKVEETHNIKKGDVARAKFREMCVDLTRTNIKQMKSQMLSMGFSQDWSREFVTMTPEYMKRTQLSFLKMYEQGLIYRGIHPVNWCPRCETAIAFAEVEYHENETYLNYLEFPVEESEKGLMIATTRPELLSACVAVVVHPEDERYKEMAGKKVEIPLFGRNVEIITDEEVDPEFGTGAVMICTFGDKTDVLWVNKYNLDIIEALDEKGVMKDVSCKYAGMNTQDCKKQIIEDLKNEGYLKKQEKVDQNVGLCWRCKTPIEILVKNQWFVAVKDLIPDVREASAEMKWTPEHMETRLLNWTGSMDWDWCISRQRIFATPVPVWYCSKCGKVHLATPDMLPVDPTQDKLEGKCECGNDEFIGETDVLDTWMDSSISPLSITGWPDEDFKKYYPASLRPQGHDIIRTWAFYTILRCKALTGEKPFDEIVVNGMVSGEDGHKMSKSRGNTISPEEVLEEYGADALRLWAANSVPGSDVPFAWKDVKYGYKFIRKFWNAFRFINMHIQDFKLSVSEEEIQKNLDPMDKWILSKLNRLLADVMGSIESYNFANVVNSIQAFIWHDFCDEYIEAVKYRLYNDSPELEMSKEASQYTLQAVISTSLIMLAPLTPHFADEIYQYVSDTGISIHKTLWPDVNFELIDDAAEETGEIGVELIGEIRRFKASKKMPLNAKIKTLNIYTPDTALIGQIENLKEDIKGTMRIESLDVMTGKPDIKEKVVEITPVMAKIGPEFKGDAPKIVNYLQSENMDEIVATLEDKGEITIEGNKLTWDHIEAKKVAVGKTGEKVEVIHAANLDVILEVIV
ncbi:MULTISPECIES: valine--tRNA ligase [Methanobacterium]|uniref:Valine--tRNA ligase n=1 Tax=Methanobacterium bryantii TaxID=2161 RepID=A0A2A2H3L2_METBR|nr:MULTISPECIES: valine--tRNA ligase [Methanobacterium]OEC86700.1 valine--tRNA ligase [Methanobacterium sp. A39]PAV03978.1 valine--tRNA ligase [Methanobacterium bryantii]